jgi:hypothetical protein
MQVSFNKYSSEYDLQNEGYIPRNYPTHTISANNHTIKYLDDRNSKIYLVFVADVQLFFPKMCYFVTKYFLKNTCCTVNYYLQVHVAFIVLWG